VLRSHQHLSTAGVHYYIAFPCMHLAQPIIMFWYLREWKRLAALLLVFDLALIPSILLLEQHYLVDLIGAVVVALAAILMTHSGLSGFGESPAQVSSKAAGSDEDEFGRRPA